LCITHLVSFGITRHWSLRAQRHTCFDVYPEAIGVCRLGLVILIPTIAHIFHYYGTNWNFFELWTRSHAMAFPGSYSLYGNWWGLVVVHLCSWTQHLVAVWDENSSILIRHILTIICFVVWKGCNTYLCFYIFGQCYQFK
jgi:hypothetical protein